MIYPVLIALLFAVVFVGIFNYALRIRGPWGYAWAMFLVMFLSMWAVAVWFRPVGPDLGGAYWLPAFIVGVLLALLFGAIAPPERPTPGTPAKGNEDLVPEERKGVVAMGFFFWGLLIVLLIIILIAHL
jgi:hypothetical protein